MSLLIAGALNRAEVVIFPKIFPALQRDRHIAISPQEVVKRSQAELFTLGEFGVGKKMQDLALPDLIADGLSGVGGKQRCSGFRRFLVHGYTLDKVVGGLRDSERSKCKLYIHFDPQ